MLHHKNEWPAPETKPEVLDSDLTDVDYHAADHAATAASEAAPWDLERITAQSPHPPAQIRGEGVVGLIPVEKQTPVADTPQGNPSDSHHSAA